MSPTLHEDVALSVCAVDLNIDIANVDPRWLQDEAAEITSEGIQHESFRCSLLTRVTRPWLMQWRALNDHGC